MDIKMPLNLPVKLYCDNKSAINIAHNSVLNDRTKHIKIDNTSSRRKLKNDNMYAFCAKYTTSRVLWSFSH